MICSQCKKEFVRGSNSQKYCKECKKILKIKRDKRYRQSDLGKETAKTRKQSDKYKEDRREYDKTEKGVIRVIYKTQKSNSKKRGHEYPSYTKKELSDWLYKNCFKLKYNNWVNSNYHKSKKPSVDRIEDNKGYSLCNIRLVDWETNFRKSVEDRINGIGTQGSKTKKVGCFCGSELICVYVSVQSIRRMTGSCKHYYIVSGKKDKNGFTWKYI